MYLFISSLQFTLFSFGNSFILYWASRVNPQIILSWLLFSIFHLPKLEIVLSCPPLFFPLFLYPCFFILFNTFTIILVVHEEQVEKIKAGLATGTPISVFLLPFPLQFS